MLSEDRDQAIAMSLSLSIMSFNLGGFIANRATQHHWSCRAPLVADLLRVHAPDILAMQEVQPGNAEALQQALSEYESLWGRATCAKPPSELETYNAIFWRRDTLRCICSNSFYLSTDPDSLCQNWSSGSVRGATWTCLENLKHGSRFVVCSTHLDHRNRSARYKGSRLLISRLDKVATELSVPIILAGDFNSRAWAPPDEKQIEYPSNILRAFLPEGGSIYDLYLAAGYKDTYIESGAVHGLDTNTYHDFLGGAFPPAALRIDWILYKDSLNRIATQRSQVIRAFFGSGTYPSDHFPIVSDLEFTRFTLSE